jgi:hypothetical protein
VLAYNKRSANDVVRSKQFYLIILECAEDSVVSTDFQIPEIPNVSGNITVPGFLKAVLRGVSSVFDCTVLAAKY